MDGFKSAAQAYFNDEKFSDLTVVCAATGKRYKSHRFLLSVHSKWFERCCAGLFAESGSKKIELKGDVPVAVGRMIEFFYRFDYTGDIPVAEEVAQQVKSDPEEEFATQKIETKLELHAWMYAIADKYEISDLKKLSLAKFTEELRTPKLARGDVELVVNLIYSVLPLPESDKTLREAVVDQWICIIGKSQQTLDGNELVAISRANPAFTADVLRRFVNSATAEFKCANCGGFRSKGYDKVSDRYSCNYCSSKKYILMRLNSTFDMENV